MQNSVSDGGILAQAQVAVTQTERYPRSEKHFPMKMSHHVNGSGPEDRTECQIAAMAVLADGKLVVFDERNRTLKAFSKNGRRVVTFGDEIRNCRDITAVEHKDRFAITEDNKEFIRHFSIKEKLIKEKREIIRLPGRGYHCKYAHHHYCVTCDVSDANFRSLAVINDRGHPRRLKLPDIEVSQIAMHPKSNEVYLSDYKNQTIFCVNFDGQNLSVTPLQKLNFSPFGISVVASSYLFVCNAETKTVLKFKPRGESRESAVEELPDVECSGFISSHPQNSLVYMTSVTNGITAFKINSEKIKYEGFNHEL